MTSDNDTRKEAYFQQLINQVGSLIMTRAGSEFYEGKSGPVSEHEFKRRVEKTIDELAKMRDE